MGWWCNNCGFEHDTSACPGQSSVTSSEPGIVIVSSPLPETGTDKNWTSVRLECIKELGYALIYMNFLNPWPRVDDLNTDAWHGQRLTVQALCEKLGEQQHNTDLSWWESFYTEIQDEIENMC